MDKETLSNYGWIVILVLILAVMLALATPFGNFIADAIWSTANGLFGTNENALEAGINGILGKENIVVDGLGEITVQNPNGAEFEYDEETGILIGKTPVTPVEPEDLTNAIPMIEFTSGTFESNTEYTTGQYELESYEVTKTRTKKPVACNGGIIISCTYVGDGKFQDNLPTPDYIDHESTYMAYCVARSGDTSVNGFVPYHLNYRTIANSADDTLENAIYIAAFTQKGTNINWRVAKWNGSKYVEVDYRAEIDAITDFTETYTETSNKIVTITKPSSSTSLVYVPAGTMKAEKGMTWAEWLISDYNTFGADTTKVWDLDYNEVALNSEIVAGASYGFKVIKTETESNWPITWNMENISNNASIEIGDGIMAYKVSNAIPTMNQMCRSTIVSSICIADLAQFMGSEAFDIYSFQDDYEEYMMLVISVKDTGGIFPETGMYVADMYNIIGQDIDFTLGRAVDSVQFTGSITDSWAEIKAHIDTGDYKDHYKLGDTKTMTLDDGTTVIMEIVAFDEDDKADGSGKAAITWMSFSSIATRPMNSTPTTAGGWKESEMRNWIQGEFYSILPAEVTKLIAPVTKTYYDYNNGTPQTLSCVDNVWIPSIREVRGANSTRYEDAGADYSAYLDNNGKASYSYRSYSMWWYRSAYNDSDFWIVNDDVGGQHKDDANAGYGVVLGFCM